MSRHGRLALRLALLIAGAFMFAILLRRTEPDGPQAAEPCFLTRNEAYQYAITRLLAAERLDTAGDPYSSTFTRTYLTIAGEKADYFLVDDPARELELAEGFAVHGFVREALAHYGNLIAFHPDTPQALAARDRIEECRRKTVLGLVRPLSVVVGDPLGNLFVAVEGTSPEPFSLDRVHHAYLETAVPHRGPLSVVGFIDDAGSIVKTKDAGVSFEGRPGIATPDAEVGVSKRFFEGEGAVAADRAYYALSGDSLFSSERDAKRRALAEIANADPMALADAMAYVGAVETARRIREYPEVHLPAEPDPSSPLYLDAQWFLKSRSNPRFTLTTKSAVTTGSELPIEIESAEIRSLTFSFAKFEGPMPGTEAELKAWLQKAGPSQSHEFTVEMEPGKRTLQLPVRDVGSYRVTVEGRGLSCSFIAVRTDLSLEIFALPGENFVTASRSGIAIATAQKLLGTTDDDGCLVPAAPLRGRICEEHRSCCASCDSCAHHHDDRSVTSNPTVFVSGRGQFFRAVAKLDASEVAKVKVPPAGPLLFVHTDRPAYKAGDTMKFRGILRVPKVPLLRNDAARLIPATEREVAVAVKCGDNTLFTRTYITGDQGTFAGEFPLPLAAYRAEYSLLVTYEGASIARPFEVMDYRKSDFSIVLTPAKDGVRIQAGYVWGAPVPDTTLKCSVGGKPADPADDLVAAKDGEIIEVVLMRGVEELARKSHLFRAPVEAKPSPAAGKPAARRSADPAPDQIVTTLPGEEEEPKTPLFTVKTDKSLYQRGERIEIVVEGPMDEAEATVVVADLQVYDLVRVPLKDGRGTVKVPVRAIHDPGVSVFALCSGYQARTDVQVRANQMTVALSAPATGRPGEKVDVVVRGDPNAAVALSAVDEAIYMLREDDAPEMYSFFHPERPAALAYARFESFEFDGETHKVEKVPTDAHFKTATVVGGRLFRGKAGVYETLGVGGEMRSGGVVGGRFGGRMNLVARGGGSRATEGAVLGSLRALCATQRNDGSWPCAYPSEAGTITDVGATGLALLSFLGGGYSQLSKDEYPDPAHPGQTFRMGEIVKKSLQWILAHQDPDGWIGGPGGSDAILNHAMAALALSEAYGMTSSQLLREPAQAAITHLVSRQSSNGGWHRADAGLNGEILTSTFAVMALKSAELSDLLFPQPAVLNALRFLAASVDDGRIRAESLSRAEVAGALVARRFFHKDRQDTGAVLAPSWLVSNPVAWKQQDFLGWYLASLALFQYDGPDGAHWKAWHNPMKAALVPNQAKSGSWSIGNETVFPTAMATLTLQVYYRYANVFGGAGGGKGRDDGALFPAPKVRLHFPDTVFWAPELVADEKGEARVSFTLPDQISTTRLTARGITKEGAAGEAVARIQTRQPFFLKILAPEFAVLDDEMEIRVELYNYTGSGLQTTVKLEGAEEIRKVHVPADGPATVSWRLRAVDPAGLRLVVHAESGRHQDSMERKIPVHRVGRESLTTTRGKSATGSTYGFEAEKDVQDLVARIRPRKGSLTLVLDALRYLNQYPYGCAEQTMAKFWPNVLTAEALKKLGIPTAEFNASFEDMMRVGQQRLLGYQNPAGGWGWYNAANEDPLMTAIVLHGLQEADRLGYKVDQVSMKRGRDRLRAFAKGETNLNQLAFQAYVLGEEVDRLLAAKGELSPYSQALLTLTLHRIGRPEAAEIAKALAASVKKDHWETPNWHQRWHNPSVETTAYALQALIAVDPNHPLIPLGREWLLSQRHGNRWRSTRETAVAISTLLKLTSLDRLGAAVANDGPKVDRAALLKKIGVSLNGGEPREILVDLNNPTRSTFEVHFGQVRVGSNTLQFQALDAHSDFEFDVEVTQRVFQPRTDAVSQGVEVKVAYDKPLESLRLGDEVTATVVVKAASPVEYVMVQSPVPAGCEVIRGSGAGNFARFEDRYEKALFFLPQLGEQELRLTYRMRCSIAGRFTVLPAWAGLMYNEDLHGTSAPAVATIRQ